MSDSGYDTGDGDEQSHYWLPEGLLDDDNEDDDEDNAQSEHMVAKHQKS